MPRRRIYQLERDVIKEQIEAKATEGQSFDVPDLNALDEDRPQTKITTSLTGLMRDLLQANHGAYAKLLVNCWYREACLGNQAAITELLKRIDGIPPNVSNEPYI